MSCWQTCRPLSISVGGIIKWRWHLCWPSRSLLFINDNFYYFHCLDNFGQLLTLLPILDNFCLTILTISDKDQDKDNLCDLTIKSNTGHWMDIIHMFAMYQAIPQSRFLTAALVCPPFPSTFSQKVRFIFLPNPGCLVILKRMGSNIGSPLF